MWAMGVEYEDMVEEVMARRSAGQEAGECDERLDEDDGDDDVSEREDSVDEYMEGGWEEWSEDEGVA
jgi:hypothetical protein